MDLSWQQDLTDLFPHSWVSWGGSSAHWRSRSQLSSLLFAPMSHNNRVRLGTSQGHYRLGNKSGKRPRNHVRESGMLEGVIHARYLYWPLLATPSLDDTWFDALNANYGRFSKWPPNILQMYIRWDLYVLETWSWCLNICFWGQGIHWAYLFEDIIDEKFMYSRFIAV